jgi:hypothetical protein
VRRVRHIHLNRQIPFMQNATASKPSFLYEVCFERNQLTTVNDFRQYLPNLTYYETKNKFFYDCFSAFCQFFKTIDGGRNQFHQFRNWIENENAIMLSAIVEIEVVDNLPKGFKNTYSLEYFTMKGKCQIHSNSVMLPTMYLFLMKFCVNIIEADFYSREALRIFYLNVVSRDIFPGFYQE